MPVSFLLYFFFSSFFAVPSFCPSFLLLLHFCPYSFSLFFLELKKQGQQQWPSFEMVWKWLWNAGSKSQRWSKWIVRVCMASDLFEEKIHRYLVHTTMECPWSIWTFHGCTIFALWRQCICTFCFLELCMVSLAKSLDRQWFENGRQWGEEGSLPVITLSLLTIWAVKTPVLSPKHRGILLFHKKQLSSCDDKDWQPPILPLSMNTSYLQNTFLATHQKQHL